jgi:uncharacterized membrane protein required for colicin V production
MTDFAFAIIVLFFAVLGFWTGFLMQVLRLVSVVGAIFLSLFASRHLANLVPGLLAQRPEMRTGLFAFITFILAYIALILLAQAVVKLLRAVAPMLSFVDRILGALVGALKGAVLATFLILLVLFTTKGESRLVNESQIMIALRKQLPELVQIFNSTLQKKPASGKSNDSRL